MVLGFLLTVLMIIGEGEVLRGAPDGGRSSVVLHFLIIAPTVDLFTPTCLSVVDSPFQLGAGLLFSPWCPSTALWS